MKIQLTLSRFSWNISWKKLFCVSNYNLIIDFCEIFDLNFNNLLIKLELNILLHVFRHH